MLFNSMPFLAFFIVFFSLYFIVPMQFRLWVIILGSTIFYGYWNLHYIFLPHILCFLAYCGGLWFMSASDENKKAKFIITIACLLLPLIFIKYSNFLYNEIFSPLFGFEKKHFNISLPLSLSFVTFTLIAYVTDIYIKRFPVEKSFSKLAGLVLFFPHLIAGPILRPQDFLPQLNVTKKTTRKISIKIVFGIILFAIGFIKKALFADQLSACIDPIYATEGQFNSYQYLLAIYGFSVQLYCDFSGYTDMAIGLALMLGLRLPANFKQPYTSGSLVEFWRRWHITLSSWLRDYLYIPLGGNKGHYSRQCINLIITMALGGLWHGANWTFLIWGLVHGFGIAFVHIFRKLKLNIFYTHIPRWIFVVFTFHFVTWAWVLFRAQDLPTAWRVMTGPFQSNTGNIIQFLSDEMLYIGLILFFIISHRFDDQKLLPKFIMKISGLILWPIIVGISFLILYLNNETGNKFIYFEF